MNRQILRDISNLDSRVHQIFWLATIVPGEEPATLVDAYKNHSPLIDSALGLPLQISYTPCIHTFVVSAHASEKLGFLLEARTSLSKPGSRGAQRSTWIYLEDLEELPQYLRRVDKQVACDRWGDCEVVEVGDA